MKLNQNGIKTEDKQLALNVRNYLISGNRVLGNPGYGLQQTLSKLEHKRDNTNLSITDWAVKDSLLNQQISLTKAGILGEEKLCEYLSTLIKYDDNLNGLVAFASLAYDFGEENDKDYIPDTDTLLVFGKHLLVVDAKNLKTKPNQALMLLNGCVIDADKGKELIEVHPSTHIWQKVMSNAGIEIESIDGYVCIVQIEGIDNDMVIIYADYSVCNDNIDEGYWVIFKGISAGYLKYDSTLGVISAPAITVSSISAF